MHQGFRGLLLVLWLCAFISNSSGAFAAGNSMETAQQIPADPRASALISLVERTWQEKQAQPELYGDAEGLFVIEVMTESRAQAAGIQPGDVLLRYDGHVLDTVAQLTGLQDKGPQDEAASLELLRAAQVRTTKVPHGRLGVWLAPMDSAASVLSQIGDIERSRNHPEVAMRFFRAALDTASHAADRSEEATALTNIGHLYLGAGRYELALDQYQQALARYQGLGDLEGEGLALYYLANLHKADNKLEKALRLYEQSLAIWRQLGVDYRMAVVLADIGNAYWTRERESEARYYYEEALKHNGNLGSPQKTRDALVRVAGMYRTTDRCEKALPWYEKALAIDLELEDVDAQGADYGNAGMCHEKTGAWDKALESHQQALRIHRGLGSREYELQDLINIGESCQALGQNGQAIEVFREGLSLAQDLDDAGRESYLLSLLGDIHQQMNEPGRALEYYQQALDVDESLDNQNYVLSDLQGIARMQIELGGHDRARQALREVLVRGRSLLAAADYTGSVSRAFTDVGRLYVMLGDYDTAHDVFQEVLRLDRKYADLAAQGEDLKDLAEVDMKQGKYEQALTSLSGALEVYEKLDDLAGQAAVLLDLAKSHVGLDQTVAARQAGRRAMEAYRKVEGREGEVAALQLLASLGTEPGEEMQTKDIVQPPREAATSDEEVMETAPTLTGGEVAELLAQSRTLADAADYAGARERLDRILATHPDHVEALWLRGDSYLMEERYSEAARDFRRLTELKPESAQAHGAYGWAILLQGKFQNALAPTQRAVELDSLSYAWVVNLGHLYLLSGDDKTAYAYYEQSLPLVPDLPSFEQGPLHDFDLFINRGWSVAACEAARNWMREKFPEYAPQREVIARLREARKLIDGSKTGNAFAELESVLLEARELFGPNHKLTQLSRHWLTRLYEMLGKEIEEDVAKWQVLEDDSGQRVAIAEEITNTFHNLLTRCASFARASEDALTHTLLEAAMKAWEVAGNEQLKEELLDLAATFAEAADSTSGSEGLEAARRKFTSARNIYRVLLGEESPEYARTEAMLGLIAVAQGDYRQGEDLLLDAIHIAEVVTATNDAWFMESLIGIASIQMGNDRMEEALRTLHRALQHQTQGPAAGDSYLALIQTMLGIAYTVTGDVKTGRAYIDKAMEQRGQGDVEISNTLFVLGAVLISQGHYDEAETVLQKVKGLYETGKLPHDGSYPGILAMLSKIAGMQGRYAEALAFSRKSMELTGGDNEVINPIWAMARSGLAELYLVMGDSQNARQMLQETMSKYATAVGVENVIYAQLLNHSGMIYLQENRLDEAEAAFKESYRIFNTMGGPSRQETLETRSFLAMVYIKKQEFVLAREMLLGTLRIQEEKYGKEYIYTIVTRLYFAISEYRMGNLDAAVVKVKDILAAAGQSGLQEAVWLGHYILALIRAQQGRTQEAIFLGKQAINGIQGIRADLVTLEKGMQHNYLMSRQDVYHSVADWLVTAGRLPEAEQVLAMLKEQEYFDFLRGDTTRGDVRQTRVDCNAAEAPWCERYQKISDQLAGLGTEYASLKEKERGGLSADEQARVTQLESDLKVARQGFNSFLDELKQGLVKTGRTLPPEVDKRHRQLQAALRTLGHGAVALHYFVTDERLNIILTTPDTQLARQLPWDETALKDSLNQSVLDLRARLTHPGKDPRPLAKELYDTLIGPIAADLEQVKAQTLMVSLDGALRYLPLAALYDGEHYLAEHYALVIYTEAANLSLTSDPQPWRVAGLGVSRSKHGDLDTVPQELEAIVRHGDQDGDGVLPGMIELDGAFTEAALQEASQVNAGYPVLHVASHFVFNPGNVANSYLVLGNDEALTLARIREEDLDLGGVELLTLSACETAMGGSGSEVEGFGALAQDQGAQGVMASLWKVADKSTGTFMAEFYRRREAEHLTKAEALRRVQLAFIRGEISPQGQGTGARRDVGCLLNCDRNGENAANAPSATADYSHPYYWAPFVLMGNWL